MRRFRWAAPILSRNRGTTRSMAGSLEPGPLEGVWVRWGNGLITGIGTGPWANYHHVREWGMAAHAFSFSRCGMRGYQAIIFPFFNEEGEEEFRAPLSPEGVVGGTIRSLLHANWLGSQGRIRPTFNKIIVNGFLVPRLEERSWRV